MSLQDQISKAFSQSEAQEKIDKLQMLDKAFTEFAAHLPQQCQALVKEIEKAAIRREDFGIRAKDYLSISINCKGKKYKRELTMNDVYELHGFRALHDLLKSPQYNASVIISFDNELLVIEVNPSQPYEGSLLTFSFGGLRPKTYHASEHPVPSTSTPLSTKTNEPGPKPK